MTPQVSDSQPHSAVLYCAGAIQSSGSNVIVMDSNLSVSHSSARKDSGGLRVELMECEKAVAI